MSLPSRGGETVGSPVGLPWAHTGACALLCEPRGCLEEGTVADYVQGILEGSRLARVDDHLDVCSACRQVVAIAADKTVHTLESNLAPEHVPGPDVGDLLGGRFRLLRVLGRGAMGVVFEAHDEMLCTQVAVKVLARRIDGETHLVHREIKLARRITHPNVCRVHDLGVDGPIHFVTMELVRGETLESLVARQKPTLDASLALLLQVAAGLAAAHRDGVVHRDMKPSNVMVDFQGHAKITDFGLARDVRSTGSVVAHHVGTPGYWSPEQERGEPATTASDVYSFGMLAIQVLRGRRASRTDADLLRGLPRSLRDILSRCVAHDPARRPASALAVHDALRTVSARLHRRRGRRGFLLGVAALALGVVPVAAFVGRSRATDLPRAVAAEGPQRSRVEQGLAVAASAGVSAPDAVARAPEATVAVESLPRARSMASRSERPERASQSVPSALPPEGSPSLLPDRERLDHEALQGRR
jgi:hypothetical protein